MDQKKLTDHIIELTERVTASEQQLKAVPEIFKRLNEMNTMLSTTCGKLENFDKLYGNGWREMLEKRLTKRLDDIDAEVMKLSEAVKKLETCVEKFSSVNIISERREPEKDGFVGFLELSWVLFRRRLATVWPWLVTAIFLWMLIKVKVFGDAIKINFFGG